MLDAALAVNCSGYHFLSFVAIAVLAGFEQESSDVEVLQQVRVQETRNTAQGCSGMRVAT